MKTFKNIAKIAFLIFAGYSVYKGNPFNAKDYALGVAILFTAFGMLAVK